MSVLLFWNKSVRPYDDIRNTSRNRPRAHDPCRSSLDSQPLSSSGADPARQPVDCHLGPNPGAVLAGADDDAKFYGSDDRSHLWLALGGRHDCCLSDRRRCRPARLCRPCRWCATFGWANSGLFGRICDRRDGKRLSFRTWIGTHRDERAGSIFAGRPGHLCIGSCLALRPVRDRKGNRRGLDAVYLL